MMVLYPVARFVVGAAVLGAFAIRAARGIWRGPG